MGRHVRLLEASPKDDVIAKIAGQHDQTIKMLQDWIALPSIAAENRGYPQGAEYMAKLAREAGFQRVDLIPTKGKPGVFATLDAGAANWIGIYFMYDVKQFDPAEWSSPPLEARVVDKPGLGKVVVGRGATNTKGPQVACLAALHAFKAAGVRPPVNIALVCEGEEEIGSPNFPQIVFKPEVEAALKKDGFAAAIAAVETEFKPIDDWRGSAAYRLQAAKNLLRRLELRVSSPGQAVEVEAL